MHRLWTDVEIHVVLTRNWSVWVESRFHSQISQSCASQFCVILHLTATARAKSPPIKSESWLKYSRTTVGAHQPRNGTSYFLLCTKTLWPSDTQAWTCEQGPGHQVECWRIKTRLFSESIVSCGVPNTNWPEAAPCHYFLTGKLLTSFGETVFLEHVWG